MEFKKIDKRKIPEHLSPFQNENIFEIKGFKKLDDLCTQLAITQDLKYILNTDSCDYCQFKKFNKQDILEMIDDLKKLANKMI